MNCDKDLFAAATALARSRRHEKPYDRDNRGQAALHTVDDTILKISDGEIESCLEKGAQIGFGGQSRVHRGVDKATGKTVAIKLYTWTQRNADNIKEEVQNLRRLRHENIVHLLRLCHSRTEVALVMPLMSTSLAQMVIGKDSLGEPKEMAILTEVLKGLAFMHDHKIVHCDIKPDNILLSHSPVSVKISDLGICGRSGAYHNGKGTSFYKAPEMIKSHLQLCEPQRDIWSLGVMTVVMCKRMVPFRNIGDQAYYQKLISMETYPLVEVLRGSIDFRSDAWRAFVLTCLAIDPLRRPRASDLLRHPALSESAKLSELQLLILRFSELQDLTLYSP